MAVQLPDTMTAKKASGWWELYHLICTCGWQSRAIDPICDEAEWRRTVYGHRCDPDD